MMSTKSDMFELACAFVNIGEVDFIERKVKNRSKYQNIAGFVNLAFACEVFLKLLLTNVQYDNKEHRLAELWKVLETNHFNIADNIKTGVMNELSTNMTFEEMLADDSNVFYNFRYFYEPARMMEIRSNPLQPQFLRFLSFHLRTQCYQQYKEELD